MEKKVKAVKSETKRKIVEKKPVAQRAEAKAKISKPSVDEVKARAYEIYVQSGHKGTEMENWLKAEKELVGKKK